MPRARHRRSRRYGLPVLALAFAVVPARALATSSPPVLTLTAPVVASENGTAVLRGAVMVDRRPSRGVTVTALVRPLGEEAWSHGGSERTDADGVVSVVVPLHRASDVLLSVDYAGGVATSPARRVQLLPVGPFTARLEPDAVAVGRTSWLVGVVPAARAGERVQLQRPLHGRWTPVTSAAVGPDGGFRFPLRAASAGSAAWRVVRPAVRGPAGVTPPVTLEVFREHTYEVRTRGPVDVAVAEFAGIAADTWSDPRGWMRAHLRFRRVPAGGEFTLVLSTAAYVSRYDPTCNAGYSCQSGRYVVVNATRWQGGAAAFRRAGGSLADYRRMVLNHELGHWLGEHHAGCAAPGEPASVMMQQSKATGGCRANAWPLAAELGRIAAARR